MSEIKERPILFSGEMVRAILEGRKTQTRRVIKFPNWACGDWNDFELSEKGLPEFCCEETRCKAELYCPYGQPSDHLWVRETWKISSFMEGEPVAFQYKSDMSITDENDKSDCVAYENWYDRMVEKSSDYLYRINHPINNEGVYIWEHGMSPLPWRPSIFMPRWASRITLEIMAIRVERVQDISEEDAIAEGIPYSHWVGVKYHRYQYKLLWDSINAKRGYPWESNPWVWAIEFTVVDK